MPRKRSPTVSRASRWHQTLSFDSKSAASPDRDARPDRDPSAIAPVTVAFMLAPLVMLFRPPLPAIFVDDDARIGRVFARFGDMPADIVSANDGGGRRD